jgi:molecular chaperone DnaJ
VAACTAQFTARGRFGEPLKQAFRAIPKDDPLGHLLNGNAHCVNKIAKELALAAQDWIEKDFYKELGVEKSADDATIKKAYRKLARKYHPDQNPGDNAAEAKFKSVSEAYSVLSDKSQRSEYDQIRSYAGGGPRFMPGAGGGASAEDLFGGMFGGSSRPRSSSRGSFAGMNLDDLFGYGGSSFDSQFNRYEDQIRNQSGGRPRARMDQPGESINAEVTLPFRTAVEGDTVELTVAGKNVKVRIPAGIKDGGTLRVPGKGYASPGTGPKGDLNLTVNVTKHPVYSMQGRNLKINVPVTFAEAAAGATIDIPKIDGSSVKLKIAPGTPTGRTMRVKDAGVKTAQGTGDLLVTVNVSVPKNLSDEAKDLLAKFAELSNEGDVREKLVEEARV